MNKKDTAFTKKYIINGPNNIIRLTNNEKILYIFGAMYLPVNMQNECLYDDNYDSMDIDKFIFKFMKVEKEKQFDLFAEHQNFLHIPKENNYDRHSYGHNFIKFFQSKIKKNNNEIKINNKYPNFRFHFMDIRDTLNDGLYIINYFNITSYDYSCLIKFDVLIKNLNLFYEYIKNPEKHQNIYIDKILNQYTDDDIRKKINDIFNQNIINLKFIIDEVTNLFDFAKKNISSYGDLFSDEASEKISSIAKLKFKYEVFLLVLTDLYFLRRFLDKNYIKNGILHTGILHLENISYLLVKYFNFKITNIFNCDPKFKVVDEIKKIKFNNYEHITILYQNLTIRQPNFEISQCVNLLEFPDNFS